MYNEVISQKLGKNTILICTATGFPAVSVAWQRLDNETGQWNTLLNLKSCEPTANSRGLCVQRTLVKDDEVISRLNISHIRRQDFTKFRCLASNHLGESDAVVLLQEARANPYMDLQQLPCQFTNPQMFSR
ncbi:hypothetical protein Ciccas_014073 [Cichlidogyrus casuarinus]|uniref:Ig-like domain-containing protein n=1 Tax=Cichlidogyrus casuarinus TaxID=1844966 RepID=A0ABD2PIZ8_9PLAT